MGATGDAAEPKRALFVQGTGTNNNQQWAFSLDNPLDGIDDSVFYSFWFRLVGSELKDGNSLFQFINNDQNIAGKENPKRLFFVRQNSQTFLAMTESNTVYNSQMELKDGWNHLWYGFQKNNVTWYYAVNMNRVVFNSAFGIEQPKKLYFLRNMNFKDTTSTIKFGELQFLRLKVEQTGQIQDIMERYTGLTWRLMKFEKKHFKLFKLQLIVQYTSKGNRLDAEWKDQASKNRIEDLTNTTRVWWGEAESALNLCNPTQRYIFSSNICVDCESPCLECSYYSESKCFSCKVGYTLVGYQCISSDCPRGQYFDATTSTCKTCLDPCTSCTNTTFCLYCDPGFKYIDDGFGKCIKETDPCPSGTFQDPSGLVVCKSCPAGCDTCSSSTQCTKCQNNYLLYGGQCLLEQCPSGTYIETDDKSCVDCDDSNCIACTYFECLLCKSGTYLDNQKCVTKCPDGFYGDSVSNSCMKCQSDCLKCQNNNYTCTACNSNTYLYGTSCVAQCPSLLYFQDDSTRACLDCDSKCLVCPKAKDDCSLCTEGNYLYNRKCDSNCPISFYEQDDTRMCYPCHSNCKDCYGSLSSQCTSCAPGFFLKESSCMSDCPPPYFTNIPEQTCDICKYFCDSCTTSLTCQVCKTGYQPIPNNCTGEYYLQTSNTRNLQLPYNTQQLSPSEDPISMSVEVWFRSDNMLSSNLEVIVALTPYKLRKRSNEASIHLSYQGQLSFCDTAAANKLLYADIWYHFAWSMDEKSLSLKCYLNGQSIGVGSSPISIITSNIVRPSEITLGGTTSPKLSEVNFNGYFKEFRVWKILRSSFQLNYFKNVDVTSQNTFMYAYWKFDEKNDGTYVYFKDSSNQGVQNFNPKTIVSTYTVQKLVEMKEIDLIICKQGYYQAYVDEGSYYICLKCNALCKNCKGPTINDCIECTEPYKLLEDEFTCKIIDSCQEGQFINSITGLCNSCDPGCKTCIESANFCQKCKANYFKEFQGTSCVSSCPSGMYGDYQKQQCYFNPLISQITPANGTVFNYGTFIVLESTFSMMNNENNETYIFGWYINDMRYNIDVSQDAVKLYYQQDQTRVHLDKNIIQPNRDYNITFYVQGDEQYYNGMQSSISHMIYIGTPPKNGRCKVSPIIGISTITEFTISQQNWLDEEQIQNYEFFYSLDGGDVYLPMSDEQLTNPNFTFIFDSTYKQYTEVKVKCKVTNVRGFSNQVLNTITLEKRSTADATNDLDNTKVIQASSEIEILSILKQISLISQNLGKLVIIDSERFDPKVEVSQCTSSTCNNKGNCTYLSYTKKYYCSCQIPYGGQNCTFENATQIDDIKQKVLGLAMIYNQLEEKDYELEFLKLASTYKELLSESTYQIILSLITYKIQQWKEKSQSYDDLQQYMRIVSNMLEFIEQQLISNNVTSVWIYSSQRAIDIQDLMQQTLEIFESIRINSLKQLSMVITSQQFITRMISFKQILLTQESLMTISATNFTKKNMRTFIKVSPNNFINQNFQLEEQFAIEVIEYAMNPYQIENKQLISNNIFSVKLYNQSSFEQVSIQNMTNGFELSFPVSDNQNLTDFSSEYNSLNPYKAVQNLKRIRMLNNSALACNYWDGSIWQNTGCTLSGVDKTHVKCLCNHLTSFAPQFKTPINTLSNSDESILNKYDSSQNIETGTITKADLMVPLDRYFDNLEELLQHKTPRNLDMLFKPGTYVVLIFWFMYISSLVYYSGRDRIRRSKMTKKQIREDLAEIKDKRIQHVDEVMQELFARDCFNKTKKKIQQTGIVLSPKSLFGRIRSDSINENKALISDSKSNTDLGNLFIQQDGRNRSVSCNNESQVAVTLQETRINITHTQTEIPLTPTVLFSDLSKDDLRNLKQRAKRKVFGKVGSMSERAQRFFKRTIKRQNPLHNKKMEFFNEALKSTLWMGLLAKTSKIAPRHVRLALLYLYISVHLLITSIAFILGYIDTFAEIIEDSLFTTLGAAILTLMGAWIIGIPVALIFRMPLSIRKQVQGVRTKKINVVFREIDAQMSCRYAIGYFICFSFYLLMTVVVTFFTYLYPSDYCIQWFQLIFIVYILDLLLFTFAFAGLQLLLSLLSVKLGCIYYLWSFFEKVRYVKNLKG
eukprot:403369714